MFVIGADEQMIEYAVKKHFALKNEDMKSVEIYARNYLEKLIQLPIRLSSLGEAESHIYITLLLVGTILGTGNTGFKNVYKESMNIMKHPWENKTISIGKLQDLLGEDFKRIQPLLELISSINPILAAGTEGNPRQIKRFLNALIIRFDLAQKKGFASMIKLDILAKIMLAEFFLSKDFFNQISISIIQSRTGFCEGINKLKDGNYEKEDPLGKWKDDPQIINWIKLPPDLENIDLRPYMFVLKEKLKFLIKKDILSPNLSELIDNLLKGKFAAAKTSSELKKLPKEDLIKIFEAVKDKLLLENDFQQESNAFIAIRQVCSIDVTLENEYLNVLTAIPEDKLGIWISSGHDKVIKSDLGKKKLEEIFKKWKDSSLTNVKLKKVLEGMEK